MRFTCFLCFALFTATIFAQTNSLNGTTFDANNVPLGGVNVIVSGQNNGAISDFDGNFTLNGVSIGDVLEFSYIGFDTRQITISNFNDLTIVMQENAESLDEVVVVGYGTQTKKELTGAVSVVSSATIDELKPTQIEQALQGQVSGVQITNQSGAPGSASNIRIRGISTNGDNRPLILVDGNVIEDLSVVNPSDVASITVLKDATAGIYGVRAANGVILITTKTGRKNSEVKFDFGTYFGYQQTTRKLPALSATDYALLVNESFAANGEALPFPNVAGLGAGTDWQDEVFENAPISNTTLTVTGGGEKSSTSFGVAYLTQDGIVGGKRANFDRFNARLNYNLDVLENLKINSSVLFSGTTRKALSENALGSVLFNALNMAPTFSVRDENNRFTLAEGLGNEVINPVHQIKNTFNENRVRKLSGAFGATYNFLKYFEAQGRIQANYAEVRGYSFNPIAFYGSGKVFNNDREVKTEYSHLFRDYTFDAFIKYKRTFNEAHNLDVTLGTSVFQTTGRFTSFTAFDISRDTRVADAPEVINNFQNGGNIFDSRLLSYFARAQYNYKEKYLFSAVVRRDGSTKFGPENKFGIFPSGSVGWVLSEESFLNDNSTIDFLKLRGSYGILGNDRIPDYRFVSLLNGEGVYVINDELVFGIATGAISNPEIQWEEQKSLNVGVDARLFNNRVTLAADYFNRTTTNLLVAPEVSGILGPTAPGSSAPIVNAGDVRNQGFEFQIGYFGDISKDVKFNINYNVTTLDNEVLKVNNGTGIIQGGSFGVGQDPPSRMETGFPIGYFYGYTTDGIFQTQEEVDAHPSQLALGANAQPGDIRFADVNGDGVINPDDRSYIGDPIPDITMGLNLSLDIKNFDFQMYIFSSIGNEIVRNYERNQARTNRTTYYLDRWTGAGTSTEFPRATTGATSNAVFSDFYVEDGSFVRAQNMQLGYTFSQKLLNSEQIDSFRIYASVSNVFTLTKYRGYDPAASSGAPIGGGIDFGFYPTPRTYLLGLNLKF
ncbi:MAG: TonB-dependent receptor [Gilvibacter sp.]